MINKVPKLHPETDSPQTDSVATFVQCTSRNKHSPVPVFDAAIAFDAYLSSCMCVFSGLLFAAREWAMPHCSHELYPEGHCHVSPSFPSFSLHGSHSDTRFLAPALFLFFPISFTMALLKKTLLQLRYAASCRPY